MKVALVNPPWSFEGSIYFGCREAHLPLELGYSRALLEQRGHQAQLFDAQLLGMSFTTLSEQVARFAPDVTVLTTAPSYLFWRCAPPELRVPRQAARALRALSPRLIVVGPHASTTPRAVLAKLDADVAVLGECEGVLAELVDAAPSDYGRVRSIAYWGGERGDTSSIVVQGPLAAMNLDQLPALRWQGLEVQRHSHHHHRFDRLPQGPGAELEASRGCPYACTFCAKENFRDRYRTRPLQVVLDELDGLLALGARYVYFIDEIFLPDRDLLEALAERDVELGVQLRIDNWSEEMLDLLGRAGCVSIEAGVESITEGGRKLLNKRCRLSTAQLTERLVCAKRSVAFVQANLIGTSDDPGQVAAWRAELSRHGVWSNEPVPLFPYPGSPQYRNKWGQLDDRAWERAHEHYLQEWLAFSELQDQAPLPLAELES